MFGLQGTGNYSTVAFDGARHAETFETRTAQAHLDSIKREFELLWDEGRIWVLLICNLVSTSLQLAVDAYLSLGVGGKTRECDSMFFDDNGGLFEQSLRLVISTGTYLVPNWGALYVFYVLPRFQFSTVLDVPGLLMDDECDEAAYELLSATRAHSVDPSHTDTLEQSRIMSRLSALNLTVGVGTAAALYM
uniref:Uncharacterized protein n=1 Tax=Phytophthora ramorum TaxID=164328 RepID=H3GFX4_PHYRM